MIKVDIRMLNQAGINIREWHKKGDILEGLAQHDIYITEREWRLFVEDFNTHYFNGNLSLFIAHGNIGYKLTDDPKEIDASLNDYWTRGINQLRKYYKGKKARGESLNRRMLIQLIESEEEPTREERKSVVQIAINKKGIEEQQHTEATLIWVKVGSYEILSIEIPEEKTIIKLPYKEAMMIRDGYANMVKSVYGDRIKLPAYDVIEYAYKVKNLRLGEKQYMEIEDYIGWIRIDFDEIIKIGEAK